MLAQVRNRISFIADRANMRIRLVFLSVFLLTLGAPQLPVAHEITDNSITVVLHEQHSLSVVMSLDFAHLLQSHLVPMNSEEEFLLAAAIADVASLTSAYTQLQAFLEREVVIASRGSTLTLNHWVWPPIAAVQASLRQQLAAQIVGDEQLAMGSALEVRAEASDMLPIERLTLKLPNLMMPATILWYQPRQRLLGADQSSTILDF